METWKILIISLLAAVAIGSVGGIFIGKYLVKRSKSNRKQLLSKKERIIYSACLAFGMALILFGVFFKFPAADDMSMNQGDVLITEEGTLGGAKRSGGGNAGGAVVFRATRAPRAVGG